MITMTMDDYAAREYAEHVILQQAMDAVEATEDTKVRADAVRDATAAIIALRGDQPEVWSMEPIDTNPGQREYHLSIKNGGSYFPLANGMPYLDTFLDQDAAEIQALILSIMPPSAITLVGWRNVEFHPDDRDWSVCVVKTRGNYVTSEFRQGKWS